jgi:hypothetical protein
MKKALLILGLIFLGFQGQSQILISIIFGDKLNSPNLEFGLEGGNNWSNISNFHSGKPLSTFNLGFYFDFKIKNNFYIYTGVLVKSDLGLAGLRESDLIAIGADHYKEPNGIPVEGAYSQKLNYFLVPVLAKYRHKTNVYVEGGPQFGLMYKSWIEFNSDIEGRDATVKEYNRDLINKIDVGGLIGAGYKFKSGPGWSVGVKYYFGFVDVYKNVDNTKNRSLFVKVNVPIGMNKKKESK